MKTTWFLPITVVVAVVVGGCGVETVVTTGIVAENAKNQAQALQGVTRRAGEQIGLSQIKQGIAGFQAENGRYPYSLDELVATGYMYQLPELSSGRQYVYNNLTGEVRVGKLLGARAGQPGRPNTQFNPRRPGRRGRNDGGSPYIQQFQVQYEFQSQNQAHYGGAASANVRAQQQLTNILRNYQQQQQNQAFDE